MSFFALRRRAVSPFFHIFLVVVPIVFVASGSYHDPQSYRYVMPLFGALPVVLAVGIDQVGQWSKAAAVAAFVSDPRDVRQPGIGLVSAARTRHAVPGDARVFRE